MEIVKDSENITTEKVELTQDQYYAALVEDFKAGEIILKKVNKYRKQSPEPGNVMYAIRYIKNNMYLYRGSYQFSAEYEAKLINKNKLIKYLIYQLSVQMSKLI